MSLPSPTMLPSPTLLPGIWAAAAVTPSDAPLLAELSDVELYLRTTGTVSAGAAIDTDLLRMMLEAASDRMIDARPERTLYPAPPAGDPPVTRRFPAAGVVQLPDLREVFEVRFDNRAPLTSGQYRLTRRRPGDPYIYIRIDRGLTAYADELVITGRWGPAAVKPAVREACIVWVARVFHQRTARFADNTQTPDGGVLGYFRNLPPDVKVVLDDLRLPGA